MISQLLRKLPKSPLLLLPHPQPSSHHLRPLSTSGFYPVHPPTNPTTSTTSLTPHTSPSSFQTSTSITSSTFATGDILQSNYEVTLSPTIKDIWHSAIYTMERIYTSTIFARKLGLQADVMDYSLMLFLTTSTNTNTNSYRSNDCKVSVFKNGVYHWPTFSGDTFTKSVKVVDVNENQVTFECVLINQRDRVVFSVDKIVTYNDHGSSSVSNQKRLGSNDADGMFQNQSNLIASNLHLNLNKYQSKNEYKSHLLSKSSTLSSLLYATKVLIPGSLLIHPKNSSIDDTQVKQLSTLSRLWVDSNKDEKTRIPEGIVLGLINSVSSLDLHEVLYEELICSSFINDVYEEDNVYAMSLISKIDENVSGEMEEVTVITVAVKNYDISKIDSVPRKLFEREKSRGKGGGGFMSKDDVDLVCKDLLPELGGKVVGFQERRIVRQAGKMEVFLL